MLKLFRRKQTDPLEALREVVGEHELPSFPAIILSALGTIRDDESTDAAVADTIASDPGLSVRLLGTVNSAAFALRHQVKSVHHAVSLMGRSQLESMMISMAVRQCLPGGSTPGYDPIRFWTTAARRATTARALADRIDPSTRSECFTAALLQDMAIPLLSHRRGDDYGPVLERWHSGEEDLISLERATFEWDHALIAKWMSCEWKFPELLTGAIASHHGTGDEEDSPLPAVQLVAVLRENDEGGRSVEPLVETAKSLYGIPEDETVEIIDSSGAAAEAFAAQFR